MSFFQTTVRDYRIINKYILPYTVLLPLNLQGSSIKARFSAKPAYTMTAYGLQVPHHPMRPRAQKRWDTRTEPLWWSVVAHKEICQKKVVRSWATRKVRNAFQEALKVKGYDIDGRLVAADGSFSATPFWGTLQLAATPDVITVSIERLEKDALVLLETILRMGQRASRQDHDRKPLEKQRRPGLNIRRT